METPQEYRGEFGYFILKELEKYSELFTTVVHDPGELSSFLGVIDITHERIHQGIRFIAVYCEIKDDGENIDLVFTTPIPDGENIEIHFTYSFSSTGPAIIYFYENPTFNTDGSVLSFNNLNRRSAIPSEVIGVVDPTVTDEGDLLSMYRIGSVGLGNTSIAGNSASRTEFVLKQGESYLLRASSLSDSNNISFVPDFYRHVIPD